MAAEPKPPSRRPEVVGLVSILVGAFLLPWIGFLASRLPSAHETHHWRLTWIGFDALLVIAFIALGTAGLRGSTWLPEAATAAGTALVIDAWFDASTAATDRELRLALLLAFAAELPLAVGMFVVAARYRGRRRLQTAPVQQRRPRLQLVASEGPGGSRRAIGDRRRGSA